MPARSITDAIARLVASHYGHVLRGPDDRSALEFPLPGTRYRADFAYRMDDGGWLFIEDDDAARAVANVAKYGYWLDQNAGARATLVHLIGPGQPGALTLARFIADRLRVDGLNYEPLDVADWHDTDTWINALDRCLHRLVDSSGDGANAPSDAIWADRRDMADSTGWVRARREAWGRP